MLQVVKIMKLYIIGNGFDIHHRLRTSYLNYREFLLNNYPQVLAEFEKFPYTFMYGQNYIELWSDLEQSLSINYNECISDAIEDGYPDLNNDSESRWYEIEFELEEQTRFIYDFTGKYFYEWLYSIDFSNCIPDLPLTHNDLYVTFNYTTTLETIYNIPSSRILPLHGCIDKVNPRNFFGDNFYNPAKSIYEAEVTTPIPLYPYNHENVHSEIQFGSTNNNSQLIKNELERQYGNDDFYGASIELGVNKIIEYCDASSKNLKHNYNTLRNFISASNINEVVIMGHSFEGIDSDYYKDILIPRLKNCLWSIYIHSSQDEAKANIFITKYNLHNFQLIVW